MFIDKEIASERHQKVIQTGKDDVLNDDWIDLLGSGAIMKKIINEGKVDTRPQRMEKCIINYTCLLEDGTVVESENNFELHLGESDVIQGLDVSIGLMSVNEKYPFELGTSIINILFSNKKRERGNWWYCRGENNIAIQCYRRALDYLDQVEGGITGPLSENHKENEITDSDLQSLLEDRISVCNNMAAAQIKMEMYEAALNSLQVVLRCQPNNIKAHYRKAKVYIGKNDLLLAMKCLQKAKELSPNDAEIQKEINSVAKILEKQKVSERELARRMFNGPKKTDSKTESKKDNGKSKVGLWATLGATVAVGVAGIVAYRFKYA
ncbi:hypothetical protein NQ314_018491 [Rhamnusium bicolor]|uniref:peptidylprolyl isomerase n=1 Tax=Rhamnusium bicolor TaxID=1586634 RepID=A0AAV8WQ31_9CUCU|nr:hypothetical protein NQ314_018491 [Rhamnusium bicolor]